MRCRNRNFVFLLALLGILLLINSCKKEEQTTIVSDEKLSISELQKIEAAGIDSVSTFKNAIFPDSSNISDWTALNDSGYIFTFNKKYSVSSSSDKKRLFIERMTNAGFILIDDQQYSFPSQPNGIAYVYNSKTITKPSIYPGASCQELLYGLDCSGMIYQMALASNINLILHGTVNYVNISTWNNAFNNSPDFQGLEMTDLLALPSSQLQAGDIIVASNKHIGMVFDNGSTLGVFNSLGSDEYSCLINSNNTHGAVITNNVHSWLTQIFGSNYHVLRVKSTGPEINNTTWDVTVIHSPTNQWHADVTFYANGTTKYDEPDYPGVYLNYGIWYNYNNQIHWSMGLDPYYIFDGTITGNTMSGTYVFGSETKTWTASKRL